MRLLNLTDVKEASEILRQNEVLAFPTDTIYGLGVISNSEEAFYKLVRTKRRPPEKPFTLMCASVEEAKKYIKPSELNTYILDNFFPGQVTLITECLPNLPSWITLNTPHIGIRVPNHPFCQALLKEIGGSALVTSCNISDEAPLNKPEDIILQFEGVVPALVYAEDVKSVPSTICLASGDKIKLIREGAVPFSKILEGWSK